jgi:hypothetical protein
VTLRSCNICDKVSPFFGTDNPSPFLEDRNVSDGQSTLIFFQKNYYLLGRFIPDRLKLASTAELHHFEAAPALAKIHSFIQKTFYLLFDFFYITILQYYNITTFYILRCELLASASAAAVAPHVSSVALPAAVGH